MKQQWVYRGDRVTDGFKLPLLLVHVKVLQLVGLGRGDVGKNIIGTGMFWNWHSHLAVSFPVWVLRSHRGLQRLGPLHPSVLQLSVSRKMRECLVFYGGGEHTQGGWRLWAAVGVLTRHLSLRIREHTREPQCAADECICSSWIFPYSAQ